MMTMTMSQIKMRSMILTTRFQLVESYSNPSITRYKENDMQVYDWAKEFEAHEKANQEAQELREHAMDFSDTYDNEELAQLIREGVVTIEEVEAGLRRRMG